MLLRQRLAIACVLVLSHTVAWGFDPSVFKTLDTQSPVVAKAFMALPAAEKQRLALEYMPVEQEANPAWQGFLLAYLSHQHQEPAVWERIDSAYRDLIPLPVNEMTSDEAQAHAQLCLLQLQQFSAVDVDDHAEDEVQTGLKTVCGARLSPIIRDPAVFAWFLKIVQQPFPDYNLHRNVLAGLTSVDALSLAQRQQLRDAIVVMLFPPNGEDASYISLLIKQAGDEQFKQALLLTLQERLAKTKTPVTPAVFGALLAIDSPQSVDVLWDMLWKNPSKQLPAVREALADYVDYNETTFSEHLHSKVLAQVEAKHDIRLAAVYLYLTTGTDSDWQHGVALVDTLEALVPQLPNDAETQAVLKYVYLQAAGTQYLGSDAPLGKTQQWLLAAENIPGKPLSWYAHLTGEKGEFRADQRSDFAGIQHAYETQQLPTLVAWVDEKQKPAAPFRDVGLGVYGLLTGTTIKNRLWHNADTGAALLLDDTEQLSYFNGFEIENSVAPVKMYTLSTDKNAGKPTLRSPLESWFAYAFSALSAKDNTPQTMRMDEFAVGEKQVNERLLFADESGAEYPLYIEYVRYGAEILLNIDGKEGIQQYVVVHPTPAAATAWMASLAKQAPVNNVASSLWYHVVDKAVMPLERQYRHADIEEDKRLSPLYATDHFERPDTWDCHQPPQADAAVPRTAAFAGAEYALYQMGYRMVSIVHDSRCDD
ncbi:MAG: hypothetical protein BWK73_44270 [Thiothrix lacustris]|uniref:Uncharacterized protein n=1 Tax=Thiothrix lacustris TaxID=525917 RepID=A0A1Y1QBR9_9GAMM|nr:MAG: hypothetical protein BWK73_44270 [Thiothrix lacustris]